MTFVKKLLDIHHFKAILPPTMADGGFQKICERVSADLQAVDIYVRGVRQ